MAETGTHLGALKQLFWSKLNILVTGVPGVNGAVVTCQLPAQGHNPIIYENRMDTSLPSDIADKLTVVFGGIMDLAT